MDKTEQTNLYLRHEFDVAWGRVNAFAEVENLSGKIVRAVARRRTLRFEFGNKLYYLKLHHGVGWREIFKNWLVLKAPVVDARNEYVAALKLRAAGLSTLEVAAFGVQGFNPASRRSFLITDEISPVVSLEQYCLHWIESPPASRLKHKLINRVAEIARVMHGLGINHRDFYICHFLLENAESITVTNVDHTAIFLVDLHRAQIRAAVPEFWLIRDLGGLFFSTYEIALTRRDWYRFLKTYFQLPLREVFLKHQALLNKVQRRADKVYQKAKRTHILPRQIAGIGKK